jgi:hypothetical protein
MSKQIDRARENHRALVQKHMRLITKLDKALSILLRLETQKRASTKAIASSQKRLDKLVTAATYTNGPTASAVNDLIAAVQGKSPEIEL